MRILQATNRYYCNMFFILLANTILLLGASCSKSNDNGGNTPTPPATQSSAKDITSFTFQKSSNSIPVDATASISGTSISIFLPPGTSKTALVASFAASSKSTVSVGGVTQTSASSKNDFTNPVVFDVKAEDGTKQSYTVTLVTDIASIDQLVAAFMSTYNVPGLSLAITKDENLVYVKSYGKADDAQAANNNSLYRLASLSKQFTSIAIMKLLDQGKISLDQKVFGTGAILGNDYASIYSANVTNITVGQLLHHTSGGWPNDGNDPMFTNPTMTAAQLITWTLNNRPLTNTPGSAYAYSNFGYCVLGRIIEKITGITYAAAVKSLVLQPSGVTDMVISGNTLADRVANEVKYYGQSGENPYAYNIARMDSHGGWLGTATDLARVLVHVDGYANKTDIISSNAISVMTTASTANTNYACGWSVNSVNNWWHTGSLPGTATEQARTSSSGKYNFVILTNTRSLNNNFAGDMDNLFWNALSKTPVFPSYDLF